LVPVIVESAESLMSTFRHVDVYLILGYTLRPHRQAILEQFLEPLGIGLQVWHDATPIHYDYITRTSKLGFIQERERVLARQHRYVIKDKLPYYDFVLAFEVRIHYLLTPCDPKCKIINRMPLTRSDFLHPSFVNSFIHFSCIGRHVGQKSPRFVSHGVYGGNSTTQTIRLKVQQHFVVLVA
jgi:hypothetical protein